MLRGGVGDGGGGGKTGWGGGGGGFARCHSTVSDSAGIVCVSEPTVRFSI